MSDWAEKVNARLDGHDNALKQVATDGALRQSVNGAEARQRVVDGRLSTEWQACRIGGFEASRSVVTGGVFAFPDPYVTGGFDLDVPSVPDLSSVSFPTVPTAGGILIPRWDLGTKKVLLYDGTGAELPNLTAIPAVGNRAYLAAGTAETSRKTLWRADGDGVLLQAQLEVQSSVALSATDYWSIILEQRAAGNPLGLALARIRTDVTRIDAGVPIDFLAATTTVRIQTADTMGLRLEATGSPEYLDDVTVWLRVQRTVR